MNRLPPRQLRGKAFLAKWSKVDWSKRDIELAEKADLSRERIRQIRQQLGAPKPSGYRRMRRTIAALRWAKENLDQIKGLSGTELRRKYGLRPLWKAGPLAAFLKPFLRDGRLTPKHRWDLMNFNLPSRDLQRIWRLPHNLAASTSGMPAA